MPVIRARIKCIATYETEIDVPASEMKNLDEYLLEHIDELNVENLQFYDDIDSGAILNSYIINE